MLKSSLKAKDKLIVALDTSDLETAKRLIDELRDHTGMFKVGLELFTQSGTTSDFDEAQAQLNPMVAEVARTIVQVLQSDERSNTH